MTAVTSRKERGWTLREKKTKMKATDAERKRERERERVQ